jgi:iron complex outermembrane receptor protein
MFSTRILKHRGIAGGASLQESAPVVVFSSIAVLAMSLGPSVAAAQQAAEKKDQPVQLEEVVVTGSQVTLPDAYSGGQVARGGRAGILGNLDMMDTPFASTNYTADLMLNQQAKSVADVLLNDPVVRVARGFGNFQEVFLIRGFPAFSDDMTYNGIYGILPRQYVAAELMERVELFRGASAFLNGAAPGGSNLGGTVNLVPKRAPDEPLSRLTVGYESDAAGYVAADVGRRFGSDGATGIRANAVYRDGETAINDQKRKLTVLSFGLDHNGENLRLALDIGYQDHHIDAPRPSVTPWGEIPKPPSADINFAQRWTYTDEEQLFGVVRAEYDLSDRSAVWGAAGMRNGKEKNVLTLPGVLEDGTTYSYRFDNAREDDVYSGEVGFHTDFDTGPVGHRVTLSASIFSLESRNAYAFSDFFNTFEDSLYDPMPVEPPPADFFVGGSMSSPHVTYTTDTTSYAIADTLSLADDKVLVTVGARQQNIKGETFDYNSGDRLSKYDESKVTPVGGIVYKPSETVSVYANYIEGLIAGDIPPTVANGLPVANGGIAQSPYQAEQIEAGVKYDSGSYGATLSVFNIKRPFGVLEAYDDPAYPDGALIFRANGEQRNRGVELSTYGSVMEGLRLLGGLTWLDAKMTKTQDGVNQGKTAVGSPDVQANVNLEWDVPGLQGLTLDGRVIYTSSQYANADNTIKVPSWTRFDIGARYTTEVANRPLTIRARVDNVADESDWVSVGGYPGSNYLVLGAPRTFVLSASVDF